MRNSSEKQKQASRENGAKSKGPVTAEGKHRVSRNALRHGLFSKSVVLDNERKQNFTILARHYRKYFHPASAVEEDLMNELIAASWRMRRLWASETRMLNQEMPDDANAGLADCPQPPDSPLDVPSDLPHKPAEDDEDDDDEVFVNEMNRLTASFKTVAATREFNLILNHQARLHRTFQNALRAIIQLRLRDGK